MIRVFLKEYPEIGFGYDVEITHPDATIADYMAALDTFQQETMADCYGCDGCCHERIPLTIGDFFFARQWVAQKRSLPLEAVTLGHWLEEVAVLQQQGQALDFVLKTKPNGSCIFLDEERKACSCHPYRSFVCRTHCCLPKSNRALDLRGQLVNAGEDELVRQLLSPEHQANLAGPPTDFWALLQKSKLADYPPNAFSNTPPDKWKTIALKELVSKELWGKLFGT